MKIFRGLKRGCSISARLDAGLEYYAFAHFNGIEDILIND